ncbi:hypothetical protein ACQP00_39095 [Dactylosporangium sp. CS-047395]|uniref:hypothetical protein n=1 Tax=Dactylosporangium sp. CS-047395 TaxID=3239936 RepID=UPI003D8EED8A
MRRTLVVLLALAAAVTIPASPGHAAPACDQPVPPPICSPDDPDPGPVDAPPRGAFDTLTFVGNGVRVTGWAADGDTTGPVLVHVYVDGAFVSSLSTGTAQRFDGFAPARHGAHSVCVWALNVPRAGADLAPNRQLGCRTYDVPVVSGIQLVYSSGRQIIAFNDNVLGETGFTVRWDYYVLQNIPGTSQQVGWPQSISFDVPAHPGTGPAELAALKVKPSNAYRLTVTAPGFGSASTDHWW